MSPEVVREGTCDECGFEWEALGPEELIDALRAGSAELSTALPDEAVTKRPADDVWSPIEYAGHLADVFDWYLERIVRMIEEDRPQLTAVRWSEETPRRRHHERPVEDVLVDADTAMRRLALRLELLDAKQWLDVGIGSDGDERTVLDIARRAVHELRHHVMDIRRQA